MKKNTKINAKRTKSEISITMRTILYLLGQERRMNEKKNKELPAINQSYLDDMRYL